MGISKGIEHIGGIHWNLFGCLVLGWLIIYFIIRKGLHQSGKVNLIYISGKSTSEIILSDNLVYGNFSILRPDNPARPCGNIGRRRYRSSVLHYTPLERIT